MNRNIFVHLGTQGSLPVSTEALSYWIAGILYRFGKPASAGQLLAFLQAGEYSPHPLDVTSGQVDAAIDVGIRNSLFEKTRSNKLILTYTTNTALAERERELADIEAAAFDEWLTEIRAFLSEDAVLDSAEKLWSAVYDALPLLVSATIDKLSGIDSNGTDWVVEAAKKHPSDSHVVTLAIRLFMHASERPRSMCRKLLEYALMNAVFAYRTTIPAEYFADATSSIRGKRLLLDTNILLALVGLTGDTSYEESVRAFASIASSMGFLLYYTRATSSEYRAAIEKTLSKISHPYNPNRRFAKGSWKHLEPSIERAYYESGLDKPTFLTRYGNLEAALKERAPDLTVRSEGYYDEEYFRMMAQGNKYHKYYISAFGQVSSLPSKADAPQDLVKHDALHIALLDIINGSGGGHNPNVLFITADRALASIRSRDLLSVAAWFAIFGSFQPAAEDFRRYFYDVVRALHFHAFQLDPSIIERFLTLVAAASDATTREAIEGATLRALSILEMHPDLASSSQSRSASDVTALDPEKTLKEIYNRAAKTLINYEEKYRQECEREKEKIRQQLKSIDEDITEKKRRKFELDNKLQDIKKDIEIFVRHLSIAILLMSFTFIGVIGYWMYNFLYNKSFTGEMVGVLIGAVAASLAINSWITPLLVSRTPLASEQREIQTQAKELAFLISSLEENYKKLSDDLSRRC